jgi:hypothetical protein
MYAEGAQDDSKPYRHGPLRDVAHEGQFVRPERPQRRDYGRPKEAPRDPFFDKPYEAAPAGEVVVSPSWEASERPATRSISANIKPKRKVAALFKTE